MSRIASFIASVIISIAGLIVVFAGDSFGLPVLDDPILRMGLLIMIGSPVIWLATILLAYGLTPHEKPAAPSKEEMLMRAPKINAEGRSNAHFSIGIRG